MTAVLDAPSFRRPPSWQKRGACLGVATPGLDPWGAIDDDEMDRELRERAVEFAKDVCLGRKGRPACPVREACLADALRQVEEFTIRGGATPQVRRRIATDLGIPRWQHGHNSGYAAHRCRCDRCTEAHAAYVAHWRAQRRWVATPRSRLVVVVNELHVPAGRGRVRAWPGQLVIAWESAA